MNIVLEILQIYDILIYSLKSNSILWYIRNTGKTTWNKITKDGKTMNKIFKSKKGITLVALVITVIILLILAGISISQLSGSGLFENAKLAEQKSKEAQEKEEGILADYANKINGYVDGTRNDETVTRAEFEALKTAVSVLQSNSNTHLIKRDWDFASSAVTANSSWVTLETVSLADYGTGKAIISYSIDTDNQSSTALEMLMRKNGTIIGIDRVISAESRTYLGASTSATIDYDENTEITFQVIPRSTLSNMTPKYTYSILLIPDSNK